MKKYLFCLVNINMLQKSLGFYQDDLVHLLQKPQNTQGEFSQQRYLKALTNPITTSGKFILIKNKGLVYVEKPFTSIESDGKRH